MRIFLPFIEANESQKIKLLVKKFLKQDGRQKMKTGQKLKNKNSSKLDKEIWKKNQKIWAEAG